MSEFAKDDKQEVKKRKIPRKRKIAVIVLITVVLIATVYFGPKIFYPDAGTINTISESSLKEVIEINDLSTLDYTYNGIVTVKDEESEEDKYHVAYEGKVTAGIDITKVDVRVDEEKKEIVITLPDVAVQAVHIDMGTLDYIFVKKKYETETVSQEAYKACVSDLESKSKKETMLLSMARENAISAMSALIEPWVNQIDKEYKVVIK